MAKGKNISIRFEQDHLNYAFEKTGISKEQELVDKFLSDFYFIGNPQKNIFNIPTLERQIKYQPNKDLTSAPELSQFDSYKTEILDADSPEQLGAIISKVEKDKSIKFFEKTTLKELAKTVSIKFNNE